MAIDPTRVALEQFATQGPEGPVVMLNLLRFADRPSYEAYLGAAAPYVAKVGGEVVYAGLGAAPLIAEDGQAWDAVVLVRYPDRRALLAMIADAGYREITALRTRGLVESVLQPTTPWPGIG